MRNSVAHTGIRVEYILMLAASRKKKERRTTAVISPEIER